MCPHLNFQTCPSVCLSALSWRNTRNVQHVPSAVCYSSYKIEVFFVMRCCWGVLCRDGACVRVKLTQDLKMFDCQERTRRGRFLMNDFLKAAFVPKRVLFSRVGILRGDCLRKVFFTKENLQGDILLKVSVLLYLKGTNGFYKTMKSHKWRPLSCAAVLTKSYI